MKKLIVSLICIQGIYSFGQDAVFQWVKQMGGTTLDHGNAVTVDVAGNVYTTGEFTGTADFDPGTGTFNLTSAGLSDVFVSKLDANGNFLWAKQFGGAATEIGSAIAVDAAGNVYTTGQFSGTTDFNPDAGTYNLTSLGSFDVFISKLDANGNFLWAKQMGGTDSEKPNSIDIDASGNIYTTGEFAGTVDFDPGAGISNIAAIGSYDVFISKLDANGNFIWAKQFGGTGFDRGRSIRTDVAGNVYTTGQFSGTADFNPDAGTYNLTSLGSFDVFVSKLDANGNFVWAKQFLGIGTIDSGYGIAIDDVSGNVYTTGYFQGTVDFDTGTGTYELTSVGETDIFISKLDANGNFVWAKRFGEAGVDGSYSIAIDVAGNVYTTGFFYETVDFDPGVGVYNLTSNGLSDIFISKLDAEGNFVWVKQCGSDASADYGLSITVDEANNVYTTGYFAATVDFNPGTAIHNLTSAGHYDVFVLKLSPCSVNSTDVQSACGSYTWIDGVTYHSSNTTATHTIAGGAANGCDSIVTLNLTINQPTSSSVTITECEAYTWPLNNQTYTTSGTYTHVIPNGNNCDSTITLTLTINQPTSSTMTQTACGSYTLNGQTYTNSGTYTQIIPNAANCDSTITLNLTINQPTSSTMTQTACGSYTLNGQTYTNSGTYTQVIPNANNCDSTITLNLTINDVNTTVTASGIVLTATQSGATYQWIDCDNNDAPIAGATSQSFTPTQNGNYAVAITANGCAETSDCMPVNSVGIESVEQNGWSVYPNPGNGVFMVQGESVNTATIKVMNSLGQELTPATTFSNNILTIDLGQEASGVYLLEIYDGKSSITIRLLKQR